MNLEHLNQKQISELETLVREVQAVMRKCKLQNEPIVESLRVMERELSDVRRKQFDAANPEYRGY